MAWTNEQLEAIDRSGTNIIVSAGAGSGKTAVLTERVIRKLKRGVDVDRLLVLTFTNEAANEMKSRIRDSIIANKLDHQLALLDSAYITTFDSFALSIVKKYHYLLNVSKNVSIVDSNIMLIKKYQIIDEIFESMYGEEQFANLVNDFCLKDDKRLKEYIIGLSDKLDLLIDKDKYLDEYLDKYYGDEFISLVMDKYDKLIKGKILELVEINERIQNFVTPKLSEKIWEYLRPLLNGKCYDDYVLFNSMDSIRFTGLDEGGKGLKEEFKKKVIEIKKLLRYKNLEEVKSSLMKNYDNITVVISIIRKLDGLLWEYKSKHDIYEFNDIAHLAIKVVADNYDVQKELKEYFHEIMVDEYQDTSSIQEEFIGLISNNNVYMVGDIKQSIYRFRNANPYIFQDKYDRYASGDGGIKIDLLKNFRSRSETLFNINEMFNLIMDNDIGNANYLESHNMNYGNTDYDLEDTHENNSLEVYNYVMDEDDEYSKEEKEIFIVAEDIIEKVKRGYLVFDKKTKVLRPIKYSDICIITDRNTHLDKYRKILEYKGIPSVLYKNENLTSDEEILVIKNLIGLVSYVNERKYDNKFRYLFTSVARSFLFEYSDDLIYQIFKDKKFYDDEIVKKCLKIELTRPLTDVIVSIIDEFQIYDRLTRLTDIDKSLIRVSNIIDIANNLSSLGYDLIEFVDYIDAVIEMDLSVEYSPSPNGNDAVKIMNIHKSKGLEFSLCYFTGMHNKFTIREINDKVLFSLDYGIIFPYMNEESGELEDTILKDLYVDNYFLEEVSEKIRLFYVAVTRCREKMIIVANLPDKSDDSYSRLVPNNARIKYRSFLDIISSIDVTYKYVIEKSANYTHEYDDTKIKGLEFDVDNAGNDKIERKAIKIEYDVTENKHFSKNVMKVLDKSEIKAMEYGAQVHEGLEFASFKDKNNKYVNKLLEKVNNNFLDVYKEYEFIYNDEDGNSYNGIIDLMLEYEDSISIIDYKLKDISDVNYKKQLAGYKNYIESISSKKVKTYLYSIIDDKLKEIES